MFSAKKRPFWKESGAETWRRGRKLLSSKPWSGVRPRVSMRVWLTALFVLVTAVAAVAAYEIVRPILEQTLTRASDAAFRQVGEQFEASLRRDPTPTTPQLEAFAATRGLQWGIVRVEGKGVGPILRGDEFRDERTVDVHIRHLREKIERDPRNPEFIHTARGVGYVFR